MFKKSKFRGGELSTLLEGSFWGTSLAIQWLKLHASRVKSASSVPDRGTKIPGHPTPPKSLFGQDVSLKKIYRNIGMILIYGKSENLG